MSFFSRLFRSGKGSKDLDGRLERLEKQAEDAAPGYVGSAYNRAGDLALREERPERAVDYYGRAIDAFLEDAQREAARGVANKILRVRPGALRTLCTLTWLDLAAKHEATALLHLRDYVDGAKARDERARAATQIYEMAKICPLEEFIGAVADALDGMDYPARAKEVRMWSAEGAPDEITDAHELAEACLMAAIRSSERSEEFGEGESEGGGVDEGDEGEEDEAEEKGADAEAAASAESDEAGEGAANDDDPTADRRERESQVAAEPEEDDEIDELDAGPGVGEGEPAGGGDEPVEEQPEEDEIAEEAEGPDEDREAEAGEGEGGDASDGADVDAGVEDEAGAGIEEEAEDGEPDSPRRPKKLSRKEKKRRKKERFRPE